MTPIRRPLTPKTLPHMVPSGMEFAPGRTVRILPRRSAEAALGRQRGPPRIDPESSPRDGKRSPRCNGTGAARNAAHSRARLAGVRRRARAEAPAAGYSSGGRPIRARAGTCEHRGSREVSGEQHGRQRH